MECDDAPEEPVIRGVPIEVALERGNPHNDQMAAKTNHDLDLHIGSARGTVGQSGEGAEVEAMATIAIGLIDHPEMYSRNRLASLVAAALIRLAKTEQPSGFVLTGEAVHAAYLSAIKGAGFPELGDTFTCNECGGTFNRNRSKEEAIAEARATFTPEELENLAVVCEDCWRTLRALQPDLDARYNDHLETPPSDTKGN